MSRSFKALVPALLALFALSVVAASAEDIFTSTVSEGKTDLTGVGSKPTLARGSASVVCNQGTYAGTAQDNALKSVTVHPVYENDCTIGSDSATFETDGCDYVLTGATEKVGEATHAAMSIECTTGHEMTVTAPTLGITLHIPPQENLRGVTYANLPAHSGGSAITVKATVTGITSTCTGGAVACFFIGGAHAANSSYSDDIVLTGYEDNGSFTQNGTTHAWSGTHGAQVGISVDSVEGSAEDIFTSTVSEGKTDLTGVGSKPTLARGSASVVCNQGTYAGTAQDNALKSVTVHPVYENDCTIGSDSATFETDGCDYVLTGATEKVGEATHAAMSIECTTGHEMTVTAPTLGITLHIPPQENLRGVTYANLPAHSGGSAITVKATVTGITSTCTGGAVACFFIGGAHAANSSYSDDIVLTGYEDNGSFTQNGTTHAWSGTHGAQVGISVDSVEGSAEDIFTSTVSEGKTDLTGVGSKPTLARGSASVVCNQGTYAGTAQDNALKSVTVHPVYENDCTIGSDSATFETDGCDYVLTGATEKVGEATHAAMSIECTTGHEMTVTAPTLGITLHIPPQENLRGVTYANLPAHSGGSAITVKATVTGITSTCTGGAVACFFIGGAHAANSSYSDDIVLTGYEDNGSFTQNGTTHAWSGTHGAQVGISVDTT